MVRAHLRLSLRWVTACLLCSGGIYSLDVRAADLAVVIDDVGYSHARGLRVIDLPRQVSLAVLPFAPHTQKLLPPAIRAGHDIIIHQPMQPRPAAHALHEQDTLTLDLSPIEFANMLTRADQAVPARLGVSNHTGSLLTARYLPMRQLMRHLKDRELFFLDSRTTAETVAMQVAADVGVVALQRDVFLDNVRTRKAIHKQFNQAVAKARRLGHAILIGHPYPETLDYLERQLLNLPDDLNLVKLSTLASQRQAMLAQPADPRSPHISLGQ